MSAKGHYEGTVIGFYARVLQVVPISHLRSRKPDVEPVEGYIYGTESVTEVDLVWFKGKEV